MTNSPSPQAVSSAAETPIQDLLRRIPRDAIYQWTTPEADKELWQLSSNSAPIGRLAHEAADRIDLASRASPADGVFQPLFTAVSFADDYNRLKPEAKSRVKDFILDSELRAIHAALAASPALAATSVGEDDVRRRLITCIEQWDGEMEYDAEDRASLADDILHEFNGPPVVDLSPPSADADKLLSSNPVDDNGVDDTADKLRIALVYWKGGHEIIEARLAKSAAAEHGDAPFPLDAEQAALWHSAQADAYRDALEMMGVPEALTEALARLSTTEAGG